MSRTEAVEAEVEEEKEEDGEQQKKNAKSKQRVIYGSFDGI